jgi:hypothetical protein
MRCPACPVPPDVDCRAAAVSPNACRLVVREAGRRDTPGRGYWTDRVLAASGVGTDNLTDRPENSGLLNTRGGWPDKRPTSAVVRTLATESRVRDFHDPPARDRPSARQSLDRLAIVKQCEHRTQQDHCGCSGIAACALGKGRDGQVSIQECLECVAEKGGAG